MESPARAAAQGSGSGAQLVLTHHGLLWGSEATPLSTPMAARLRALLCAGVSLVAYHLPLDAHPEIGNNALLRDALGLAPDERPFGKAKGSAVGLIGRMWESCGKKSRLVRFEQAQRTCETQRCRA